MFRYSVLACYALLLGTPSAVIMQAKTSSYVVYMYHKPKADKKIKAIPLTVTSGTTVFGLILMVNKELEKLGEDVINESKWEADVQGVPHEYQGYGIAVQGAVGAGWLMDKQELTLGNDEVQLGYQRCFRIKEHPDDRSKVFSFPVAQLWTYPTFPEQTAEEEAKEENKQRFPKERLETKIFQDEAKVTYFPKDSFRTVFSRLQTVLDGKPFRIMCRRESLGKKKWVSKGTGRKISNEQDGEFLFYDSSKAYEGGHVRVKHLELPVGAADVFGVSYESKDENDSAAEETPFTTYNLDDTFVAPGGESLPIQCEVRSWSQIHNKVGILSKTWSEWWYNFRQAKKNKEIAERELDTFTIYKLVVNSINSKRISRKKFFPIGNSTKSV